MKRLLTGALALLLPIAALATTLNPVQLLNPTGSTSGQAIVSSGASSAPAWGNVPVANVTGAAALTGATFTGDLTVSEPSAALIMNDTSGSGFPQFVYRSAGVNKWIVFDAPSTHLFTVNRYVGGTFQDTPLTISNSSGVVTMTDGITASPISGSTITSSPISGSTGSFTTLTASSTLTANGAVAGAGFSTYLGSPPAIGTTAPAAGKFTTLQATSTITPSSTSGIVGTTTNDNANAGSVGEYVNSTIPSGSAVSLTSATSANITSISLTAGDWDVWGQVVPVPAGGTTITQIRGAIATTSAAIGAYGDVGSSLLSATQTIASASILTIVPMRLSLSGTTTVFLVGQATFTGSTCTAFGFISARRRR